jgi:tetratricopeptide (TPR) repeat protein
MAAIPEFVFLNCCFLGSVDPDAEQRASARYHELAANLGTAFIKLGARAVVAAGWAVDDAAARLFADVLYARLLDGETFGWASFEARRTVYDTFGVSNNTWGAYQCYGDPGFRLFADARPASMSVAERPYVHVGEAVTDVSNIMQDAETMALRDPAPLLQRLRAIRDKVEQGDPGWLEDAELGAALGEAYGAFGLLDEAIDAYATALRAENAKAPIRVIEQLANLQARRAARNNAADAEQIIRKSIGLVNNLPRLPDDQLTSERWSLLGSCYKRLAQVTTGEARLDALRQMALSYEHGFERGRKGSAFATYPLLNWLLATSLLALFEQGREPDDVDHRLQEAANQASAADRDDPNFWHAAALADVALGLALRRGSLDDEEQRTIIEAYLRAWRRGASAIKFASVLEQIEFVRAILCDDSGHARADLCHALSTIADRLRSVTGVS